MAESYIGLPLDGTGKKLRTETQVINSNTVHQEGMLIANPTTADVASVLAASTATSATDNPLVVALHPSSPLPSGTSVIGHVVVDPGTSGGCSVYHKVAAANNNAVTIKGSAGQVYSWNIFNNTTYPIYVKLYNETSTPNPAADTVFKTIGVQAGTHVSGGEPNGIAMGTGIGIAIVTGISDTDNTAVAASDCVADIQYK